MKWFNDWVFNKVVWAYKRMRDMPEDSGEYMNATGSAQKVSSLSRNESPNASKSIRVTIYPANGGYVIEHHMQDRYKDQIVPKGNGSYDNGPTLTIVDSVDKVGEKIAHIMTMEALKA